MAFIYEKIVNYLKFIIDCNADVPDFKLPTESQICIKFNASRITARRALAALKEEGLIISARGKGYYISDSVKPFKNDFGNKLTVAAIMTSVTNKHHRNIIDGLNAYANANNINLIIYLTYNDPSTEQSKINNAVTSRCDGVVLFPSDNDVYSSELFKLKMNKLPTVLVDRDLVGLNLPCVSSNHFELAYQAVRLLYQKGVANILFVSHQKNISASTKDRLRGIEQGLLDNFGRIIKDNFMNAPIDNFNEREKVALYVDYLASHPGKTGIIYTASPSLLLLIEAIKEAGLKLNDDVCLILIDDELENYPSIKNYKFPTIKQDGNTIGETALKIVTEMIREKTTDNAKSIFIPTIYKNWN
ncbi:MAG: GntR family transcriptional regulator [Clostridia bacterium]|nr:GntR family transcriptional regulator [Clostridia bacterium]